MARPATHSLWTLVLIAGATAQIFSELTSPNHKELAFMKRFGYLPSSQGDDVDFAFTPHSISDAIRAVQHFAGIKETGIIDEETKKLFTRRRCGRKDMEENPVRRKRYMLRKGWRKREITYKIINGSSTLSKNRVEDLMAEGLAIWAPYGGLRFVKKEHGEADIKVLFTKDDHGDGTRFDGRGNVVAHAFDPPYGDMHFDDDEIWGENPLGLEEDVTDFFAVAVHEIGHALGLGHSTDNTSVMYPYYQVPVERLYEDDILGMHELYFKTNIPEGSGEASETTTLTSRSSMLPSFTKTVSGDREEDSDEIPDLCYTNYDTLQVMNNRIYVFEEEWMWVLSDKKKIELGYPKRFHEVFVGLPAKVTTVKAIYQNRKGNIVIFHGRSYWEFNKNNRKIRQGKLTDFGVPRQVSELSTVFLSNYNNRTYLINYERFWRFDEDTSLMDPGYPKKMSAWREVPYPVDAAIVWEDDTFFFRGPRFWRFDSELVRAHEYYPVPVAQVWFPCEPNAEMFNYLTGE